MIHYMENYRKLVKGSIGIIDNKIGYVVELNDEFMTVQFIGSTKTFEGKFSDKCITFPMTPVHIGVDTPGAYKRWYCDIKPFRFNITRISNNKIKVCVYFGNTDIRLAKIKSRHGQVARNWQRMYVELAIKQAIKNLNILKLCNDLLLTDS